MVPDNPPKLVDSRDETDRPHRIGTRFSTMSSQLYPYHQQAFAHSTYSPPYSHLLHRSSVPPPPLPPKPSILNPDHTHEDHIFIPSPPPPPLSPSPPRPPPSPLLPPPTPQDDEVVTTSPIEDSDELAMVLALSQSESAQKRLLEEQLMNQEEEDLARALAASMLPSENNLTSPGSSSTNETPMSKYGLDSGRVQSSPSYMPLALPPNDLPTAMPSAHIEESSGSSIPHDPYADFGRYDKWRIPDLPGKQQVEEAPKLEAQPIVVHNGGSPSALSVSSLPYDTPPSSKLVANRSSISSISSLPYTKSGRRFSVPPEYTHSQEAKLPGHLTVGVTDLTSDLVTPGTVLAFDDAAYSPQEQSLHSEESQQDCFVNQPELPSTLHGKQNAEWHRPQSSRTMSHEELYRRQYPQDRWASTSAATFSSIVQSTNSPLPVPEYTFPPIGRTKSHQPDIRSTLPDIRNSSIPFVPVVYPSLGSPRGSASDTHSESSNSSSPHLPHTDRPQLHLDTPSRNTASDARRPSQTLPPQTIATTSASTLNQRPLSSAGVLNINHFVDRDLLCGVSIGFKGPVISTRLIHMEDQMPNIISLPYTRCPPLHIQAPDWRHLLRLMARLSGTRMEPTVEAMAVSKTELKLRTVVQFVKPHANFDGWRSVLWFTIDQPVPSSAPSASRYTSGNPNLLPWSYTQSALPVLLRDACDTNMSKTYTIPATDTIPLPTLPITLPNLALYLQAALDTSRRHISDSPNGLGKFGKMVQMCYPNVNEGYSEYDMPERTTVGHLFKHIMGRSNKDKKKGKGTNNEETYQLVTPFVPDEWG